VRRAIGRITPAAAAKQVTLHLEAGKELPSATTDATRVEQILVNLLGNAVRHTPEHTTVTVSIEAVGDRLVIQVDDEGQGIAPEDLEQIFDIYVTKAGEEARGVGLGLPLSRRLARLLGGELRALSRPGVGGRFLLEVPLAET
jgi:signal transduction histidine kinase